MTRVVRTSPGEPTRVWARDWPVPGVSCCLPVGGAHRWQVRGPAGEPARAEAPGTRGGVGGHPVDGCGLWAGRCGLPLTSLQRCVWCGVSSAGVGSSGRPRTPRTWPPPQVGAGQPQPGQVGEQPVPGRRPHRVGPGAVHDEGEADDRVDLETWTLAASIRGRRGGMVDADGVTLGVVHVALRVGPRSGVAQAAHVVADEPQRAALGAVPIGCTDDDGDRDGGADEEPARQPGQPESGQDLVGVGGADPPEADQGVQFLVDPFEDRVVPVGQLGQALGQVTDLGVRLGEARGQVGDCGSRRWRAGWDRLGGRGHGNTPRVGGATDPARHGAGRAAGYAALGGCHRSRAVRSTPWSARGRLGVVQPRRGGRAAAMRQPAARRLAPLSPAWV
jgi:hypothetical protein